MTSAAGALRLAPLGLDDLDRLAELEQCQPRPWTRAQLAAALADPACWVAGGAVEKEGEQALVAYAVVARLPFEAELQMLLVHPAWRRRGLAVVLLEALIEEAGRWGSERLLLEVRAGNRAALALYRQAGFIEEGRRKGYYPALPAAAGEAGTTREDAVLMSRRL
ncbi:GNAT family N-acetyltransferase [Halomonas sp. E19]|uniref:GNAT family N-acetyltransferase n=1 Tax=unclassified Halomonas TaxID=2609666 RepID=UPI0040349401